MRTAISVNNIMGKGNLESYSLSIKFSVLIRNLNLCLYFIIKNQMSIIRLKESGKHNATMHHK